MFTYSSMLEIYNGESDLSRRAITYHLKELSFREYIYFSQGKQLKSFSLEELLENHKNIANEIISDVETPLKYFKEYLTFGAYPYHLQGKDTYLQRLIQTVNLIIETDMNAVENVTYEDSRNIKKLLIAIAQSAPFIPNISKLSGYLKINRTFLLHAIRLLSRADLILEIYKPSKGIGALTKPDKLYLHNTNLIYALDKNNAKIGAIRETFFANQLKGLYEINLPENGDFLIDKKYIFEIGGKGKTTKQIKNIENFFIVCDDMEVGSLNIIPLWLFGFLY